MNRVQTLTFDEYGDIVPYVVDFDNKIFWKCGRNNPATLPFRSSFPMIQIVIFPIEIIAKMFFLGRPYWMWGMKEVKQPPYKLKHSERK